MLIFDKNETKENNIAERVAFLIGKNYDTRKVIKKDIKNLYDIRSKIVHTGLINIPREDHIKLIAYTNAVIITLIKSSSRNGFIFHDELRKHFEKVKLS